MSAPEPNQEAVPNPLVFDPVMQRATHRIARLQSVTAALSESLTPAQVGGVVVGEGVAALEASAGSMVLLTEDGTELEVVRAVGYPEALVERWRRFSVEAPVPIAEAVRTGEPVYLENREAWLSRFPDIDGGAIRKELNEAWAALPLVIKNRAVGAIGLTFPHPRDFSDDDRVYMLALTRQCAQALERARLYDDAVKALGAAEAAQRRMAFLAEVSAAVAAASLDLETTLAAISRLLVPQLADWCAIDIKSDDGAVQRLAVAHVDPAKAEIIREVQRQYPLAPHGSHPVLSCLAGQPQFAADVSDADLQTLAQDADHLHLLRELNLLSYLCVPLTVRDRTLGAITLVTTAESGRRFDADDRALAEEMGRRAALSIDNARLYREAQEEIAERKRAEEEMRLISARAQCILWHATVEETGKYWLRWDMHVADEEAAQRFFPLDTDPPEMPYTFAWHLSKLSEDKESMEAYGASQVRANNSYSQEFRCRGSDGQVRWFKEDVQIEPLAPGKWRAVGVCTDITERKRTEEAIRESEKRFQVMADTAPVLIWLSGEDRLRYYFNKPWLDFTGRTLEQEMGSGWAEGVHPDDLARCLDIYLSAFEARKPFEMEYRLRRHDGEYRWILGIGTPRFLEDLHFAGFIGSCIDVTERKHAEDTLIENEHRQRVFLRDVLASVTEGKLRLCDAASDLPAPLPAAAEPIELSKPSLRWLRQVTREVAISFGFPPERWHDLLTAVGEASMNAVVHAGGGWARVHASAQGTIQVWIEDMGAGIDVERLPRATLERGYTTAGSLGHGFWMMLRSADRVWLLTGPEGTRVVLEQDCAEPEPSWLTGI